MFRNVGLSFSLLNQTILWLMHVVLSFSGTKAANCSIVTCDNGGTCNNFTVSPPCICPLPYIAPYCASAADYCNTLQPDKGINELPICRHGSKCVVSFTDPYFNCTDCPDAYTGTRCDVEKSRSMLTIILIVIFAILFAIGLIIITIIVVMKLGKVPTPKCCNMQNAKCLKPA